MILKDVHRLPAPADRLAVSSMRLLTALATLCPGRRGRHYIDLLDAGDLSDAWNDLR